MHLNIFPIGKPNNGAKVTPAKLQTRQTQASSLIFENEHRNIVPQPTLTVYLRFSKLEAPVSRRLTEWTNQKLRGGASRKTSRAKGMQSYFYRSGVEIRT